MTKVIFVAALFVCALAPASYSQTADNRLPIIDMHLHAETLDGEAVGPRRAITMPGVAVTVGEQIEALRRVAGEEVASLIREEPDETIWAIVQNWPTRFEAKRARALGFAAEASFDEIVRAHIEDELS